MKNTIFAICVILGTTGSMPAGADTAIETTFYEAVGRGDVDTILDLLHPAARQQVDRPVLEAWARAARANLGDHLSTTLTSTTRNQRLTGSRIAIEADLVFKKGTAKASIGKLDGKLIAFNVQSEQMRNWFQGPTNNEPYAETAIAFITSFLSDEPAKARSLMHEALRKLISLDSLKAMMSKVAHNGGSLKSLEFRTHRFSLEGESPALFLVYDVECEHASGQCELEFQFVGMKGHLLGFNFR